MKTQGSATIAGPGPERLEAVRSAFLSGARTYGDLGSPLYRALCTAGADDEALLEIASHAQQGAQPAFHLLASVHFLLLDDPSQPLARFYATVSDAPAHPDGAFDHFAAFCRAQRDAILEIMATRTVQTTYVERCGILLPLISAVAEAAGEPLDLIEMGCSAGILLTLDKYAYALDDGRTLGSPDAPFTVDCVVRDGPPIAIPQIGRRIGLDLNPLDVRDETERQWLVALSLPELRYERRRLLAALDTVSESGIELRKGDALELIDDALADTPGPLCVYHSACLSYWPQDARDALEEKLRQASRTRDIYRAGIEAPAAACAWHTGSSGSKAGTRSPAGITSELSLARYRNGKAEHAVISQGPIFGPFDWTGSAPWS
ncbi:MAG: DUF2332 domain-containing protein [Novosphingobium sp.]|nr:DUF2332 domain-containing protein [Novosphingobium sp.]MCP5403715.1 DUF2332 domain-containing protein [Novosphingobium sp.]